MDHDKRIMLVAQKEASTDEPGINDLFSVGTVASILQMLKLPDGTVKVLVEGLQRARITTLSDSGEHFAAQAEYLESPVMDDREQEVLVRTAINQFEGYIKLNKIRRKCWLRCTVLMMRHVLLIPSLHICH